MKSDIFKSIIVLAFACLFQINGSAQDIHFSQFSETPLLRNPALAGIFSGDLRIQGVFRNQWNSVTVPFQTSSLNAEYKLPVGHGDDFLTIGGAILYDKAGTIGLTSTSVLPVLNYHKSLSEDRNMYLSAGFSAGIVQRRFDASKMTTNSQYNGVGGDATLATGENFSANNFLYFDGSAGLSFNSQIGSNPDDNLYFGVGYHHFNQSARVSFYNDPAVKIYPKWVYSAGVKTTLNDYAYMTFYADYSTQGSYSEMIGGMLYSLKLDAYPDDPQYIISGGGFLRWNDAFIPVVKMELKPLTFALSYDVNISTLKTSSQSRGGFELSLSYQKFLDRDNSSSNAVRCP
ncbi:MAG TPA: PorP/SprF family type IX secretion system membrane protein, partial [Hanamia sp.]|nr:PorP/SprF family type IX secretion system membrane protein [Hanamia sp.]